METRKKKINTERQLSKTITKLKLERAKEDKVILAVVSAASIGIGAASSYCMSMLYNNKKIVTLVGVAVAATLETFFLRSYNYDNDPTERGQIIEELLGYKYILKYGLGPIPEERIDDIYETYGVKKTNTKQKKLNN